MGYRDLGVFQYSFIGSFIDRDRWIEASLEHSDFWQGLLVAERLLKETTGKPPVELAERLIPSIERAMGLMGGDRRWEPLGWKLLGVCFEAKASVHNAL